MNKTGEQHQQLEAGAGCIGNVIQSTRYAWSPHTVLMESVNRFCEELRSFFFFSFFAGAKASGVKRTDDVTSAFLINLSVHYYQFMSVCN